MAEGGSGPGRLQGGGDAYHEALITSMCFSGKGEKEEYSRLFKTL